MTQEQKGRLFIMTKLPNEAVARFVEGVTAPLTLSLFFGATPFLLLARFRSWFHLEDSSIRIASFAPPFFFLSLSPFCGCCIVGISHLSPIFISSSSTAEKEKKKIAECKRHRTQQHNTTPCCTFTLRSTPTSHSQSSSKCSGDAVRHWPPRSCPTPAAPCSTHAANAPSCAALLPWGRRGTHSSRVRRCLQSWVAAVRHRRRRRRDPPRAAGSAKTTTSAAPSAARWRSARRR